jgi:hypothetical protein
VIILPGNGCTDVYECNWYGWLVEVSGERDERIRGIIG